MAALPSGTVTFVFTDIQGSTALLNQLGERYKPVLHDHDSIIREAASKHGGVEVSTAGDSFFLVFGSAVGAVEAAVAAQRALATHRWPADCTVRVRIGVHTGEATVTRDNYAGMDVNRASRIAASAHGGQVIVSGVTRGLVENALPEGVSLRDLGLHRLKDLPSPEHLHDLVIEGLDSDFPPPRSLDARPNNLPHQLTSFVGREHELEKVKELFANARLLTLTGPGGTGKTRLALRVAEELLATTPDGVFFVDLSAVTDEALVPSTIAKELSVAEVPGRTILEVLRDHLLDKEIVLVLDNFEQVATAGPILEELLRGSPRLKILVTSRFVLSIRGEHEFGVPPLAPPDLDHERDLASLEETPSVRLFVERARAVQPSFSLSPDSALKVAEIVARLDGLPLAIELAATRSKILTPEQMLQRLDQRLSILSSSTRTLPERQRTLRGAIAWSHDLLDASDQGLFARLSVFLGGWTLEAAEAVCRPEECGLDVLDGLSSLVDKSLVRRSSPDGGSPRFSMLETIREFAEEQLGRGGDEDRTRARHAKYFLDLALEAEPHLTAEDQAEWLDRCDAEHDNIRAALRWAIAHGDTESAQASAGALWRFWHQRGHIAEGRKWFDEVLAMPRGPAATARAKALIGAGGMAWWQRDRAAARDLYDEAVAVERERGDPVGLAEALYNQAFVIAGQDIDEAARVLEESKSLFLEAGNQRGIAQVSSMLVIPDARAGDWEGVVKRLEETTAIWRDIGDRLHLAFDLVWLAFAYGRVGRRREAWATGMETLDLFCAVDNATGIGIVFNAFSWLALWEGRDEDTVRLTGVAESIRRRTGGPPGGFAGILEGDPAEEARSRLPAEVADKVWNEGLDMTIDEALAYARSAAGASETD